MRSLLLQKFKERNPNASRVTLLELSLGGLLTGEEYFMGSADVVGHPLYDRNMNNMLLQKILDDGEIRFIIGQEGSGGGGSNENRSGATSSGTLPGTILQREVLGALQFPAAIALSRTSGQNSGINDYLEATLVSDVSGNLNWSSEYTNTDGSKQTWRLETILPDSEGLFYPGSWDQGGVVGETISAPQYLKDGELTKAPSGWYAEVSGIDLSPLGEVDPSLGYYYMEDTNNIRVPRIPGKRFVGMIVPSDHKYFRILGGYVLGEGPTSVFYDISGFSTTGIIKDEWYTSTAAPSRSRGNNMCHFPKLKGVLRLEDMDPRKFSGVISDGGGDTDRTIQNLFNISMNPFVFKNLAYEVTSYVQSEEIIEGLSVQLHSVKADVSKLLGVISKEDYFLMMQTGLDVYPAMQESRVQEIRDSWKNIPDTVWYNVKTFALPPTSLKDTWMYKEQGRIRAKACKDNNFMELPFNNEYTMKQVENKLAAKAGGVCIALNASDVAWNTRPGVGYTVQDLRLVKVSATTFNYVYDKVTSTTQAITVENIEAMFDKYPNSKVTGDVEILTSLGASTSDIDDWNGQKPFADVTMEIGRLAIPIGLDADVIINTMNPNDRAIFFAHQVTDYAQFDGKWLNFLRSCRGDKVLTKLLSVESAVTP